MARMLPPLARHGLLLALAAIGTAGTAAPPRRIVSLNLCADQYLLALADPGQIAALTQYARDPAMSAGAAAARRLPQGRGTAEEVVALEPDLVLASPKRRAATRTAIAGRHYRTLNLSPATDYPAIVARVREVAAAVGHPDRGEALIRRMDAALARLPAPRPHGLAAYYQRRGYVSGTGTLIDDLMKRVSLTNLAGRLGRTAVSQLSLEQLVAARPDYLLVESDGQGATDQGSEMLHHPILAGIPRLRLPQAWTVCGGPAYVLAAQSLAAQLARH